MPSLGLALAAACSTGALLAASGTVVPTQSRAVRKNSTACGPIPDFSCLSVQNVTTPIPLVSEALIRVTSTSVNPDDFDSLVTTAEFTPGFDFAGEVVSLGALNIPLHFNVGDRVWGIDDYGGWAEYTAKPQRIVGVLPKASEDNAINMNTIGTLPTVGLTLRGALRAAGAPWKAADNVTVIITAGTGGTGYVGVQLAKILGASHVITAATGPGIAFAKSLGADAVADYTVESVFDVPGFNTSVDVVLTNHFNAETATRAMEKLSANPKGGVYVTLVGDLVPKPPPNVTQVFFDLLSADAATQWVGDLDELAGLVADGKLRVVVDDSYPLANATQACQRLAQGHVMSKLALVTGASVE